MNEDGPVFGVDRFVGHVGCSTKPCASAAVPCLHCMKLYIDWLATYCPTVVWKEVIGRNDYAVRDLQPDRVLEATRILLESCRRGVTGKSKSVNARLRVRLKCKKGVRDCYL